MNKILLVGCGHMGNALLTSWQRKTNFQFSVIDPIKYKKLNKKFSNRIKFYKNLEDIKNIHKFDVVIFAIRPQISKEIISKFHFLDKSTLFISIIAGKKISFFDKCLRSKKQIIRVMPNMPAFVEKSMSCLVAGKLTSKKNKTIANKLFDSVGSILWLPKESDLDKITAISGSGPAYYFLFIECMESIAMDYGFNKASAKLLIYQTALGSISLLSKDIRSASELKKSIAIKGGTTEAAIKVFEKKSVFKNIIKKAIKAAYLQSIKLGKNK